VPAWASPSPLVLYPVLPRSTRSILRDTSDRCRSTPDSCTPCPENMLGKCRRGRRTPWKKCPIGTRHSHRSSQSTSPDHMPARMRHLRRHSTARKALRMPRSRCTCPPLGRTPPCRCPRDTGSRCNSQRSFLARTKASRIADPCTGHRPGTTGTLAPPIRSPSNWSPRSRHSGDSILCKWPGRIAPWW
jgi:hypothetical protein